MKFQLTCLSLWVWMVAGAAAAAPPQAWWPQAVEAQLVLAKENRGELEKALHAVPAEERAGMVFIVSNMPAGDLTTLKAEFLISNHELAYKARRDLPWGREVPEEVFLNNVLPYANVDERRDPWRQEFYEMCLPLVKDCKTAAEAAIKLNRELFAKLSLKYAPQRRAPNLSPKEAIAQGNASCTGLSIVLSDACRSVGIPTRLVGTPNWSDKRGNHTWIEIWDKQWHFTGACEQDPAGLDRGWFVGDAAKAIKDSPEHAIYAVSFRKTGEHFPLVWAKNDRSVPGENVTDRYARPQAAKAAKASVAVRVVDENKKRIRVLVKLIAADEKREGISRGENSDLNDHLTFEVEPETPITVKVGAVERTLNAGKAGELHIVDIAMASTPSSRAVGALHEALVKSPMSLSDLSSQDFAQVALAKDDAAVARKLIWEAHASIIRQTRSKEMEDRIIREEKLEMPFDFRVFGEKPKAGRSLWISLHGGGGAPPQVNDQQWQNQKRLYTLDEGIYLAPRAPTNTWNLWHEAHIDRMFARLIENMIVLHDVDPNRVYVMGYSAGGDGVYQIAPRMADRWAAAAMMAGHPNGVSMLSLRNVPFALQVGGNDNAYDRAKVGRSYGEQLAKLHAQDPQGYHHFVKIHEGKGHWMNLEDKAALPWMAKFQRNPLPQRVVWKQTGTLHDRSYWLAVPMDEAKGGSLVIADRQGQIIDITEAQAVKTLRLRLDDRIMDLDQPIVVKHKGREIFKGPGTRTIGVMLATLAGRGDPQLMFDGQISVDLPAPIPE